MNTRGRVLRLSERLLRRACLRLPEELRDERYREWAAEIPAILDDPDVRPALVRWAGALLFAMDQRRTVRMLGELSLTDRMRRMLGASRIPKDAVPATTRFWLGLMTFADGVVVSGLLSGSFNHFVFLAGAIAGAVTVSIVPRWFLHRDSRHQRSCEEGPGDEGAGAGRAASGRDFSGERRA